MGETENLKPHQSAAEGWRISFCCRFVLVLKILSSKSGNSESHFLCYLDILGASLVAQKIENLPATRETQVQSLGREDPLEKGIATHPSTLPWRIPWTEEPGWLQFIGVQRVGHDWATNTFTDILNKCCFFGTIWSQLILSLCRPAFPALSYPVTCTRPDTQHTLNIRWVNEWLECHSRLVLFPHSLNSKINSMYIKALNV